MTPTRPNPPPAASSRLKLLVPSDRLPVQGSSPAALTATAHDQMRELFLVIHTSCSRSCYCSPYSTVRQLPSPPCPCLFCCPMLLVIFFFPIFARNFFCADMWMLCREACGCCAWETCGGLFCAGGCVVNRLSRSGGLPITRSVPFSSRQRGVSLPVSGYACPIATRVSLPGCSTSWSSGCARVVVPERGLRRASSLDAPRDPFPRSVESGECLRDPFPSNIPSSPKESTFLGRAA